MLNVSSPQLTPAAFGRAAEFLRQSRPLEHALFAFHFEAAPATTAIAALGAHQNPDGGFHGLEPDIGFSASTTLSTCHALHLLHDLRAPADHPLVQGALDCLLTTYDSSLDVWPIIPPHDNSQPHAPWWRHSDRTEESWRRYQDNPRPDVLACLFTFPSEKTANLRSHVAGLAVARLQSPAAIELDSLRCYLRLFDTPRLSADLRQALQQAIPRWVKMGVERDPAQWAGYRLRPLDVAPVSGSPWREILPADIEANLDYLIATQTQEGCWDPHWTWGGNFPEAWPIAKRKWQAILTLANLRTLRSYGRIAR